MSAASEQVGERELGATESLCPTCLERVSARHVAWGDDVYLVKSCARHGASRAVVWRGPPSFTTWRNLAPARPSAADAPDCPRACGPCAGHRQRTCCALLEVTARCNLRCRFCFASAGGHGVDPDLATLERAYRALLAAGGPCNIQLSGGEPTLRDDLPEIIALGRSLDFDFFQLNTNGVRLAHDDRYVRRLAEAGLGCVFLQFDGVSDEAHRALRGLGLSQTKRAAIAACVEHGLGVVLVPTVVPGVNDHELGAIVDFALSWGAGVRGVHFQPVSWFGRFPRRPTDASRITLPEVMRLLETQTRGMIRVDHLRPPSAESAHCSFHAEYTRTPAGLEPRARRPPSCCSRPGGAAGRARDFVAARWLHPSVPAEARDVAPDALDAIIAQVADRAFCISGMAFQDVWTVDLARLRDCIVHVATPAARVVPFCAYNLTSLTGASLHR